MKFPERSAASLNVKNIIKMSPEETIIGVFRGEIYTFNRHWENQKPYPCHGDKCLRCKSGNKPQFRFQLNFVTKENAVLTAKIFEQGWTVMEQLEELNKEYPLEHHWVKITRKGNGTDTSYTILPMKNSTLTAAHEKEVQKVALNVLDQDSIKGAEDASFATDGPDSEDDADISFPQL